jgi:hypothetical protein
VTLQIHWFALAPDATPSANTMRIGPPSAIGMAPPSPVRVASSTPPARTSVIGMSTW